MKIPNIAILGVTTTAACADPIIGDWNLNEVCFNASGSEYCQSFPLEEDGTTSSVSMKIESDLTGEMVQEVTGADNYTYSFPVTAEKEAANEYKITISASTDADAEVMPFDCTLEDKALSCLAVMEGMNVDYKYEKQQLLDT